MQNSTNSLPTLSHSHKHAFGNMNALCREGLVVSSRRNMVKASMAGMAGLTLPNLLQSRAEAARVGRDSQRAKSVILLWMTGGPSQIDTWSLCNKAYTINSSPR